MNTSQELHVIFGSGPVGLAVMSELNQQGKSVRVVNRSGKAAAPAGVETIACDVSDGAAAQQAAKGATVVYNCTNPPYTQWPELFPKLQAGVLEAAKAAGAKLVSMENLYMYGPTGGKPLTEDLPYSSTTRKGRTRAAMAQDLLKAHQRGDVRVSIGRASDFFGPHALNSAAGERVFRAALTGKAAQFIGKLDMPHTYSFTNDIGRALVILGQDERALGKAWHLPNAPTLTTRQFITMIYAEVGQPPRISVMPKLLMKGLGLFMPVLRELDEMLYEFEEPFIVDSSAFERTFAMRATPLEPAIRETVAWFRANP